MEELVKSVIPTAAQIQRLQGELARMPQAELQTEHYFANGMYCRKLWRPAGTLIVGKMHKHEPLFIVCYGDIIAWTESGMRRLKAGDVIESKPGTKRATLAETDALAMTVHRTEHRDLDAIEAEIIEKEDAALFDARNLLKAIV